MEYVKIFNRCTTGCPHWDAPAPETQTHPEKGTPLRTQSQEWYDWHSIRNGRLVADNWGRAYERLGLAIYDGNTSKLRSITWSPHDARLAVGSTQYIIPCAETAGKTPRIQNRGKNFIVVPKEIGMVLLRCGEKWCLAEETIVAEQLAGEVEDVQAQAAAAKTAAEQSITEINAVVRRTMISAMRGVGMDVPADIPEAELQFKWDAFKRGEFKPAAPPVAVPPPAVPPPTAAKAKVADAFGVP